MPGCHLCHCLPWLMGMGHEHSFQATTFFPSPSLEALLLPGPPLCCCCCQYCSFFFLFSESLFLLPFLPLVGTHCRHLWLIPLAGSGVLLQGAPDGGGGDLVVGAVFSSSFFAQNGMPLCCWGCSPVSSATSNRISLEVLPQPQCVG